MDREMLLFSVKTISDSFKSISKEVAGVKFEDSEKVQMKRDRTYAIIIGIVGKKEKGRIFLETGDSLVKAIAGKMDADVLGNTIDTFLCLAEFANMYCGSAVTEINNKYRGSDLRLTPPAVFSGAAMSIATPKLNSIVCYFKSVNGMVSLDIGFEGE
jgi:CheY-specific phosphatase CheX